MHDLSPSNVQVFYARPTPKYLHPADRMEIPAKLSHVLTALYDTVADKGVEQNQLSDEIHPPWHAVVSWERGNGEKRSAQVLAAEGLSVFIEEIKIAILGIFLIEGASSFTINGEVLLSTETLLECIHLLFSDMDRTSAAVSWRKLARRTL